MLSIEDYALHQTSGCAGKVLGYGHQILNDVYVPTLKVRLLQGSDRGSVLEDVSSAWVKVEQRKALESIQQPA